MRCATNGSLGSIQWCNIFYIMKHTKLLMGTNVYVRYVRVMTRAGKFYDLKLTYILLGSTLSLKLIS